jgi:hypothetical protein
MRTLLLQWKFLLDIPIWYTVEWFVNMFSLFSQCWWYYLLISSFLQTWEYRRHRYQMVFTMVSDVNFVSTSLWRWITWIQKALWHYRYLKIERHTLRHLIVNNIIFLYKQWHMSNEHCPHYRTLTVVPNVLLMREIP